MRAVSLPILAALLLLALPPVAAQDVGGPSWEMGWVTDVDPKYVVDLEEDWDLTGELVYYVTNDGPAELNLDLTYDYDEDGPFSFDGPDSISVPGNGNETFRITVTGGSAEEVRSFSPSSSIELLVVGEEKVGDSTLRSQDIEADVAVPRMFRLVPEIIPPTNELFAGSWVEFTLEVSNLGNTQDAITSGEAIVRSCPHLAVGDLEQLTDVVVAVTAPDGKNKMAFTLKLEASSSHQERTCEVSISVASEGDGAQRSATFNVNVVAPSVDNSPVDGEGDDDDDFTTGDDNSMPWSGSAETLVILLVTWVYLRRR